MRASLLTGAIAAAFALTPAHAEDVLRVCSADNDLPYTNERAEGFEDRLATVLATGLGARVERVAFPDPRFLVRDGLDKNRCDVMLGVDSQDPRVQATQPYYRSNYVFLTRTKDQLQVRDWDSPVLRTARLGVVPGTPAELMVTQIGRYADTFRYMMKLGGNRSMRNRFVRYDIEKLVRDLAAGEIDVAVAWAPAVARYVKTSAEPLTAVPVPEARKSNGEPVRFTFDTSIGVRRGDAAMLGRVEAALQLQRAQVMQVLEDEGIKLLGQDGARVAVIDERRQP